MVILFDKDLPSALKNIAFQEHQEFLVHDQEELRTHLTSDEIVSRYGEIKWNILDLINEKYKTNFDHYNWLNQDQTDEVAYFINEAGSNVLSYSQFKAPFKFHLWLGQRGFIIGIEQRGKGFPAEQVHNQRLKENEGAAFEFFRNCKSQIFFDKPEEAKIVFMEYLFPLN